VSILRGCHRNTGFFVTTLGCTYTPMELYVKIGVEEESPPLDKGK